MPGGGLNLSASIKAVARCPGGDTTHPAGESGRPSAARLCRGQADGVLRACSPTDADQYSESAAGEALTRLQLSDASR